MAARELGRLSVMDALSLVVLYARVSYPKFEPAALGCLRGVRHERAEKTSLRLL